MQKIYIDQVMMRVGIVTICITNIPDQYDEIKNSIASTHQYEVGSVLAFTKVDNIIVVGWDGTDSPDRWFPGMSGKFFQRNNWLGLRILRIFLTIYTVTWKKSQKYRYTIMNMM